MHNDQTFATHNFIKQNIQTTGNIQGFPSFDKIKDSDIADVVKNGSLVKRVSNSITHFKNGNKEFLYDSDRKIIEEREFDGKNLKHSLTQSFQADKSGRLYPAFKREISYQPNNKGQKFWQFRDVVITNYKLIPAKSHSSDLQSVSIPTQNSDNFAVYPNPVTNEVWVQIPKNFFNGQQCVTTISDVLGKIVLTNSTGYSLQSIDVSKLANGSYTLQISNDTGDKQITRFVKN